MFHPVRALVTDRSFKALVLVLAITLLIGMVFYHHVEHWSLLNSLYFCVITLSTVGYGDYTPHTDAGKIFTMVYILFGLSVLLSFVAIVTKTFTKHYTKVVEGYIKQTEEFFEEKLGSDSTPSKN